MLHIIDTDRKDEGVEEGLVTENVCVKDKLICFIFVVYTIYLWQQYSPRFRETSVPGRVLFFYACLLILIYDLQQSGTYLRGSITTT